MNQDSSVCSGRPELKVFVSSPGDVAEERLIAKRVLDRLADEFAPDARIESILWEHEPLLASGTFSDADYPAGGNGYRGLHSLVAAWHAAAAAIQAS